MKKYLFLALQVVWSVLFSIIAFYVALKNADFSFGGGNNSTANFLLLTASALYAFLTAGYAFIGSRTIKGWSRLFTVISVIIALLCVPVSFFLLPVVFP